MTLEPHHFLHLKCDRLTSSSDEFAQLRFDFAPARLTARFPAPIGPKPCSMPPQDRVRLNDAGQTEQAWPDPGHPHHQGAITAMQPQTAWCTPQGNIELMPKKEVLDFKSAPRPEQVKDNRPKQMEDRKHRLGGCADSASSCESVRMRFLGTTGVHLRGGGLLGLMDSIRRCRTGG